MNDDWPMLPEGKELDALTKEYFVKSYTERHASNSKLIGERYVWPLIDYLKEHTFKANDYKGYTSKLHMICQDWINFQVNEGRVPATVFMFWKESHRFFSWCVRSGHLIINPMKGISRPPVERKPRKLITPEQYAMLRDYCRGKSHYGVVVLGYHTGMSMCDCCLLRWSEVDLESLVITRKRHKLRNSGKAGLQVIPILPGSELHDYLVWMKEHPPDYWVGDDNDYVNPMMALRYKNGENATYKNTLGNVFQRLGLQKQGITFANLRHTFTSDLANSNCSTAMAMKITGHSQLSTFQDYINPDIDAMRNEVSKAVKRREKKSNEIRIEKPCDPPTTPTSSS